MSRAAYPSSSSQWSRWEHNEKQRIWDSATTGINQSEDKTWRDVEQHSNFHMSCKTVSLSCDWISLAIGFESSHARCLLHIYIYIICIYLCAWWYICDTYRRTRTRTRNALWCDPNNVCMFIYVYIYMCICTYIYEYKYMCVFVFIYMWYI